MSKGWRYVTIVLVLSFLMNLVITYMWMYS